MRARIHNAYTTSDFIKVLTHTHTHAHALDRPPAPAPSRLRRLRDSLLRETLDGRRELALHHFILLGHRCNLLVIVLLHGVQVVDGCVQLSNFEKECQRAELHGVPQVPRKLK